MTPAITLEELLGWNQEAALFWKEHLEANPALLELPCDIGGTKNVMEFVRHIWGVELRWGQRIAGLPLTDREAMASGPLASIFDLHVKAVEIYRSLLDNPSTQWEETMPIQFPWLGDQTRNFSRRKLLAHALFHSQRHWAQLATLVRAAGFPSKFMGDILLSSALT